MLVGLIFTSIVCLFIMSGDLSFTLSEIPGIIALIAGASLVWMPFAIGAGMHYIKTQSAGQSILVGIVTLILAIIAGASIFFGLTGEVILI